MQGPQEEERQVSHHLSVLWNLCVNAEVRLSLAMGLGPAHWPACSHGESVTGPHPADWLRGCDVWCLEVSRTPSLLRLGLLAESNYPHEVEVIIIYSDVFQDEE